MNAYLKNHSAEIDRIAISLADHFAKPLYHITDAKSYSEYIRDLKRNSQLVNRILCSIPS